MLNDNLIIESIQTRITRSNDFTNIKADYIPWYKESLHLLNTIFGEDHHIVSYFKNESYTGLSTQPGNFYEQKNERARQCLKAIIEQIKIFGLTVVKGNKQELGNSQSGVIINNTQNQSQQQSQIISFEIFVDILETDLDDEQKENLKDALTEYKTTNNFTKAAKFIKTLGDNVLANIVSSIILNPSIINQLINYLNK